MWQNKGLYANNDSIQIDLVLEFSIYKHDFLNIVYLEEAYDTGKSFMFVGWFSQIGNTTIKTLDLSLSTRVQFS